MKNLKEVEEEIRQLIAPQCELTKIEMEGPQLVLYLKSLKPFYEDHTIITKIAAALKKKVTLRTDSSELTPPEEALEKIKKIIPPEAGVSDLKFDPSFNEVVIDALKPGVVIGKQGMVLKEIITQTGWTPRILRTPTSPSEIEKAIRNSLHNHAEERKKFMLQTGKKLLSGNSNCDWVKITALGGYKEVGRSSTLLQTPNSNILIDCGINTDNTDKSKAYPYLNTMNLSLDQIDAVILTHAHLDHSGFVPYLYAYGYEGPLYCTPPTRDLSILLQEDAIKVMNSEFGSSPYAEKDIKKELQHVITRDYGEITDVTSDVKFTFHNAGHILGGAQVHFNFGEGQHNLVMTGDIKYGKTKLLDMADARFPRIETLIMESTYGGSSDFQPRIEQRDEKLIRLIKQTIERKGKVLIPVFAVGRSQEVMLTLEEHFTENDLIVYIDGMSREANAIHTVYPEYLRKNIQKRILQNNSPFDKPLFKNVISKERKDIAESDEPCVILAPSGMLSGGTSLEFLKMLAHDPKNSLIFVGYQAVTSLGRKIQSGQKEIPLVNSNNKIETLKINMEINTAEGFSGHSDRNELISYVKSLRPRPQKIFTLHGDETKCDDLARTLMHITHAETRAPMNLDSMRLK